MSVRQAVNGKAGGGAAECGKINVGVEAVGVAENHMDAAIAFEGKSARIPPVGTDHDVFVTISVDITN